jgi:hypothetical protein
MAYYAVTSTDGGNNTGWTFYTTATYYAQYSYDNGNNTGWIFDQELHLVSLFLTCSISVGNTLSRLWVLSRIYSEVVYMVSSFVKVWTLSRIYAEVVVIASSMVNAITKIFTEIVSIVEVFIRDSISKLFEEIVVVGVTIQKSLPKLFTEIVKIGVTGLQVATKVLQEIVKIVLVFAYLPVKVLNEVVKVIQSYTKIWTAFRTFTQVVIVNGLLSQLGTVLTFYCRIVVRGALAPFNFGKTMIEIVSVKVERVKLVLNGILVGLWKKIKRVTGVWRKISRGDD